MGCLSLEAALQPLPSSSSIFQGGELMEVTAGRGPLVRIMATAGLQMQCLGTGGRRVGGGERYEEGEGGLSNSHSLHFRKK